jgi:hypothetical protein
MTQKHKYSIFKNVAFIITLLISTSILRANTEYEGLYKNAADNLDKLNEFLENAEYNSCIIQCPGYLSGEKSIKKSYCLVKCKIAYQTEKLKRIIAKNNSADN